MPIYRKSNKYVLHVHIPKCGGTSLERAFKHDGWKYGLFDGLPEDQTLNHFFNCSPQHWHAEILDSIINPNKLTLCFAIIREPIARMVSEYSWRKKHFNIKVGPNEWISKALKLAKNNPFVHDNHIRPQHEFIPDYCRVFKIENGLQPVFKEIEETCGFSLTQSHENRLMTSQSNKEELLSALKPKTIKDVKDFYRNDYLRFYPGHL